MKWKAMMIAMSLMSGAAYAQPGPPPPGGWDGNAFWRGAPDDPRQRIDFLQQRVDRGRADGSLDPGEAFRVQRELDKTRRWLREMHYSDGGPLSPAQFGEIQARIDRISRQIRWLRHNGW